MELELCMHRGEMRRRVAASRRGVGEDLLERHHARQRVERSAERPRLELDRRHAPQVIDDAVVDKRRVRFVLAEQMRVVADHVRCRERAVEEFRGIKRLLNAQRVEHLLSLRELRCRSLNLLRLRLLLLSLIAK